MQKKYLYPLGVAAAFVWGIALRAVEIINRNYLFGFDQGRDYLAAVSIVEKGKQTLIGAEVGAGSAGLSGLFHGPGYFYLIAAAYKLFHGDPYGALVVMFILGVLSLVAAYAIGRIVFGKTGGLLTLIFVGIAPLLAAQSRFQWNPNVPLPFVIAALLCAYLAVKRPWPFMPLSLFIAGFTYHFELAVAAPLTIGLLLSYVLFYRVGSIKVWIISLAAMGLAFLPMAAFEVRHDFNAVRGLYGYVFTAKTTHGIPQERLEGHIRNYQDNLVDSFAVPDGFISREAYLYLAGFLFVAAFVYQWLGTDDAKKRFVRLMLAVVAVSWGTFLLLDNVVWDYYLTHVHVIVILLFVLVVDWAFRHRQRHVGGWLFAVLSLFMLSQAASTIKRMDMNYTGDIRDTGGTAKIVGKKAAIDYVYKDAGGKPFSVYVFVPPIYTYDYDYLWGTYGKTRFGYAPERYGYQPDTALKGTVYLLIEDERDKPWRSQGWLDTVVPGGTVSADLMLPTGQRFMRKYYE